jgi:hypothetical protein
VIEHGLVAKRFGNVFELDVRPGLFTLAHGLV